MRGEGNDNEEGEGDGDMSEELRGVLRWRRWISRLSWRMGGLMFGRET